MPDSTLSNNADAAVGTTPGAAGTTTPASAQKNEPVAKISPPGVSTAPSHPSLGKDESEASNKKKENAVEQQNRAKKDKQNKDKQSEKGPNDDAKETAVAVAMETVKMSVGAAKGVMGFLGQKGNDLGETGKGLLDKGKKLFDALKDAVDTKDPKLKGVASAKRTETAVNAVSAAGDAASSSANRSNEVGPNTSPHLGGP